jgi:hypothetical protein
MSVATFEAVSVEQRGGWLVDTAEPDLFTHLAFGQKHLRQVGSTNPIDRPPKHDRAVSSSKSPDRGSTIALRRHALRLAMTRRRPTERDGSSAGRTARVEDSTRLGRDRDEQ